MFGQVGLFNKFAGKAYEDKRPRDRCAIESARLLGVLNERGLEVTAASREGLLEVELTCSALLDTRPSALRTSLRPGVRDAFCSGRGSVRISV